LTKLRIKHFKGIFLLAFFLITCFLQTQEHPKQYLAELDGLSWAAFCERMEARSDVRFFFKKEEMPDIIMKIGSDSLSLFSILQKNFVGTGLKVSKINAKDFVILKGLTLHSNIPNSFFASQEIPQSLAREIKKQGSKNFLPTHNEFIWKEITIGEKKQGHFSQQASISGTVLHSQDKTPVFGATIYIEELKKGTSTDINGNFSITLNKGKYTAIIKSLDTYETKYSINLLSDGKLDILLEPKLFQLKEVVVQSERYEKIARVEMGIEKLSVRSIKEIPVVLGEKDINKVALLLPGVQSLGEGSSGFNVRGSPVDQSIFYVDHIPVYNTSHLFGLFSAFNSDAIGEFTLYKSHIPIKYGGHLSSIFELEAKRGSNKKFGARGGISPITSRIQVEGPIKKEKSSFLVGLRSTYSDWLLKMVKYPDIRNSKASFYDMIAKFSFQLNNTNHLSILAYGSKDKFKLSDILKQDYHNLGASVSWRHAFNMRSDFQCNYAFSQYVYSEQNEEWGFAAYKDSYQFNTHQINMINTVKFTNEHKINYGINSSLYLINRGDYSALSSSSAVQTKTFEPESGLENGVFFGDNLKITKKLEIESGIRYNLYCNFGPKTVYQYKDNLPRVAENITDTLTIGRSKISQTYQGLDFRVGATYLINEDFSVKASYNRLHQYIYLLSNTIAISPTDVWKLSDTHLKPMRGDQYSLGFYKNIMQGSCEISIETYFKNVNNLVDYKDGANFKLTELPETEIIQGKLNSYGVELMLKKPHGRFNGWVNYTFSRAEITAVDEERNERNNFGQAYPANYDKPHAFNFVANYKFSRRFSISGNVVYATGRPITYPTGIYFQNGMEIIQYSQRNKYRLPDYFRVDLSLAIEGNLKLKKLAHGSVHVSVYNLTGRRNAYSLFFKSENGKIKAYKLSIFGAPIFSIAYTFKLGSYEK
jgi:TonB dependent receptor-like, beta-barrel/CarboxypepD_reg-like domain